MRFVSSVLVLRKIIFQRGQMSIRTLVASCLFLVLPLALPGQTQHVALAAGTPVGASSPAETQKLEHFDPNLVDKALDPCDDFYKYSCNKWLTANPIPADQVYWSTGSGLEIWNESLLRDTLQAASANDPKRTALQQKIGDYWAACMDESGIEAAGVKPLKPEFDRIAALHSKKEITLEIARLHHQFPGAWSPSDNQSNSPLFGFTGGQDYDDASKVVAQIDQGGLSLPNRDFYLNTDEKSAGLLKKYHSHLQKMFVLAGEPEAQGRHGCRHDRRDRNRAGQSADG
jgi:putative endopeptidase